jgi:hypothetical protein
MSAANIIARAPEQLQIDKKECGNSHSQAKYTLATANITHILNFRNIELCKRKVTLENEINLAQGVILSFPKVLRLKTPYMQLSQLNNNCKCRETLGKKLRRANCRSRIP